MPSRAGSRQIAGTRRPTHTTLLASLVLGGVGALACTSEESADGIALSEIGDDVERDGWVDTAHVVSGDGATRFESDRNEVSPRPSLAAQRAEPFFYERGFDVGPATAVVGEHLLSLSRYRGLVSTRVAGADGPRVEASVPLDGLPVGLVVSSGVAAVFVVDATWPCYTDGACARAQTSRVVLVDVQDPAQPRALGEQRFAGTLFAAREGAGRLHVLAREVVDCISCSAAGEVNATWLSFDRESPTELPPPVATHLPGAAAFDEEWLFVLSPGAAWGEDTPAELRLARLSEPEPALSSPLALRGAVDRIDVSGGVLRVDHGGASEIDTYSLEGGTPVLMGSGRLSQAERESLWNPAFDGDRAFSLPQDGQLAVLDLADPNAPRVASRLALDIAESRFSVAGDRLLAVGRSTLAADAPSGEDTIAHGPQAVVLVDVADPAAPRVLDRVTLGSFESESDVPPELRGARALVSYHDRFSTVLYGARPDDDACRRSVRRLMGYDISSDRLVPVFAFDGLDFDARWERVGDGDAAGDEWWVASSVSVSRYAGSSAAPSSRLELSRRVDQLRALADGAALFGVDFTSNAPVLELAPASRPIVGLETRDVATAVGVPRLGCEERRRWSAPAMERAGTMYALRFHLPEGDVDAPVAATLHALDALAAPGQAPSGQPPAGQPSSRPTPARSLELPPLDPGEDYLGAIQTERALLIAHGRRDAQPLAPDYDSRALFGVTTTDPTYHEEFTPSSSPGQGYQSDEGLHPDARLGYTVIDLSDPTAPVLASRLDVEPALAQNGFLRSLRGVTRDTTWGFHTEGLVAGPAVVSGSIVAGQHSERAANGLFHFYLDRFDFSDPSSPRELPPVEIPGSVLHFDAQTGELITLEVLRVEAPAEAPCGALPGARRYDSRRALNALRVDGEQATRVGRLLLDTGERDVVHIAVSNGVVYYATDARPRPVTPGENGCESTDWTQLPFVEQRPPAARELTIERIALRDGRFERLPSFDVVSAFEDTGPLWHQFVARGERVLWANDRRLFAVDFAAGEPRVEVHDIGLWGCASLDLRDNRAYCGQQMAGYVEITLDEP